MRITTRRRRFPLLGLLATAAAAPFGCAVESASPRVVGRTSSAITATKEDSVRWSLFKMLTETGLWLGGKDMSLDIPSSTFQVTDSNAVFTPSPKLAAWLDADKYASALPPVVIDIDKWWSKSGTVTVTSLSMTSLSVYMDAYTIKGDAHLKGKIHVQTSGVFSPNPDIEIRDMSVSVSLMPRPSGEMSITFGGINMTVDAVAESCDLLVVFGCKGMVDGTIASQTDKVKAMIDKAIRDLLEPELAAKSRAKVVQLLEAKANADVPASEPKWSMVPDSVSLAGSELKARFQRTFAPTAPTGVKISTGCAMSLSATGVSDDLMVLQLLKGGAWVTIGHDAEFHGFIQPFRPMMYGAGPATFRVCATNSAGFACADAIDATVDAGACGGGGGADRYPTPSDHCLGIRGPDGVCVPLAASTDA